MTWNSLLVHKRICHNLNFRIPFISFPFFGIEVVYFLIKMYPNSQLVRSSEGRRYQKRDRPKGCQREGPVWRRGGGRVEGLGRRPHSQGVRHDVSDDGLLVVADQEVRPGSSSPHAHVLSVVRLTLQVERRRKPVADVTWRKSWNVGKKIKYGAIYV